MAKALTLRPSSPCRATRAPRRPTQLLQPTHRSSLPSKKSCPIMAALCFALSSCGQHQSWTEFRDMRAGGTTKTCVIDHSTTWDDALACLQTNPYTVPGRQNVRESHRQLTADRFEDVWKVWVLWDSWEEFRLTFERTTDTPYRVLKIEYGDVGFNESR